MRIFFEATSGRLRLTSDFLPLKEELEVISIKCIFWYYDKQEAWSTILLEYSTRQNRMQTIFVDLQLSV
jgi:hypothetical protein